MPPPTHGEVSPKGRRARLQSVLGNFRSEIVKQFAWGSPPALQTLPYDGEVNIGGLDRAGRD
jgi:hypothetical protein